MLEKSSEMLHLFLHFKVPTFRPSSLNGYNSGGDLRPGSGLSLKVELDLSKQLDFINIQKPLNFNANAGKSLII